MSHAPLAPCRAAFRPFAVVLTAVDQRLVYTALAHSSGEALCMALALPDLVPPLSVSVRPLAGHPVALAK